MQNFKFKMPSNFFCDILCVIVSIMEKIAKKKKTVFRKDSNNFQQSLYVYSTHAIAIKAQGRFLSILFWEKFNFL